MKLRLAAIVFLVAVLATGLTWLSFQPVLAGLLEALRRATPPGSAPALVRAGASEALPWLLMLDLLLVGLAAYAILWLAVARPVQRLEAELGQLERLDLELGPRGSGGPLLARVETSLRRTASALQEERSVTHQQLEDLRRANEHITRAQEELVSAERLATVGRLAAGVAHEVGNPLAALSSLVQMLKRRGPDAYTAEKLDLAGRQLHRIERTIRELIDFSRPASRIPCRTRICEVVDEALGIAKYYHRTKQRVIATDIAANLPCVLVTRDHLTQVILNLVLNAIDATDDQGHINLRARAADGWLELCVEDDGRGISLADRCRLFQPFFTTKPHGTGLGLFISRQILEEFSGTLTFQSEPGRGSAFTIRLPVEAAPAPAEI